MEKSGEIVNKVAQSALVNIDLENLYPEGDRILYDIADNLFQGIVLKEKEFRDFLKEHDWSMYRGKHVAITCSSDAIIPTWAYMLLTSKLQPHAATIILGDLEDLERELFKKAISRINPEDYIDAKVVIKGCSKVPVPSAAYVQLTSILQPYVSSIMFGEPCSTVPVYKAKNKKHTV